MAKTILSLIFFLFVSALMPAGAMAAPMIEIVDNTDIGEQSISIGIEQNVLHVSGASGQTLQIYKVTGVGVMSVKVNSDSEYYTLDLAKGCYIVKIGNIARKISII